MNQTNSVSNQATEDLEYQAAIARIRAEQDKLDLEKVTSQGFTLGQLRVVFNTICNKENWKYPIDAVIPVSQFELCNEAAIWFAGSPLTITGVKPGNMIRVHGKGYYSEIGA